VHLCGGGGEGGPESGIGEIALADILSAGVTTVVGVLGLDDRAKTLRGLHAKAKALESKGITAYLYTGSYSIPAPTLTGCIIDDLTLVGHVIGTGEVAISDHRSTAASVGELIRLAAQTHTGGMLGGKAGVLHIHVGDGKDGLGPLLELIDRTDLPMGMFVPTHVNRNERLFHQAVKYLKNGGRIDLTAGETAGIPVPEAVARLQEAKADLARVTVSSDANGSVPGGGTASIQALYDDVRACIQDGILPPDGAFRLVTENVARCLKLHPAKGVLQEGSDGDILVTDRQFNLVKLIAGGSLVAGNVMPVVSAL
jgi:beta-aspartyl-dipeptidase (metallo-type)